MDWVQYFWISAAWECVADYLTQPKVWWQKTDVGIEFFDVEKVWKLNKYTNFGLGTSKKKCSTLLTVGVNVCWRKIPPYKLKVKNGDVTTTIYLTALAYFRTMALEMINSVYKILDATEQECDISLHQMISQ